MPSQINPRSGPFPIYGGSSPPTVDVGIFTVAKTGVDLKTAGNTVIFTVPTGRTYMCVGCWVLVTAVTSGGAGTENVSIIESSANGNMLISSVSDSGTPVAGKTVYFNPPRAAPGGLQVICAAGNNVIAKVATSQAGSTAVTGTVYVTGFYTS